MTNHELGDDAATTQGLLRRGGVSFVGGVTAGVLGLALAIVVGRGYGPEGSGVFFSVVAVTMVASNAVELGADTAFVWALPRLRATGRADRQRQMIRIGLIPVVLASVVAAAALWLASGWLAGVMGGGADTAAGLQWAAVAVLLGTLATVAISITRGLGLIAPLVLMQNGLLPLLRVGGVGLSVILGASVVTAIAAWSLAWAVVGVTALVLVASLVRRTPLPLSPPSRVIDRALRTEFWGFAVPRALAAIVEIALVWLDVILVTILIGPAQAGIYAVASRFVTTGALGETALRIALAPRFSALFAADDHQGAQRLLRDATPLMVALTWPIFLVALVQAVPLLSIFGFGFDAGAPALQVLCVAMLGVAVLGPVQSVLLMSGNTRLQLLNKSAALAVMVGLNLALVPTWGIVGSAVAWAAAVVVDNGLAAGQLWHLEEVRVGLREALTAALLVGVGSAVPLIAVTSIGLSGMAGLIVSAVGVGLWVLVLLGWRTSPMALTRKGNLL